MNQLIVLPALLGTALVSHAGEEQPCPPAALDSLNTAINVEYLVASACKVLPDHQDTLLASAVIKADGDYEDSYQWRVMLLEAHNYEIKARFESRIDTGDATTRVDSGMIWLDTARYHVADDNRAFGVRLALGDWPRYAQGGRDLFLTLFSGKPQHGQLVPLVDQLPLYVWQEISADYQAKHFSREVSKGYINVLPTSSHGLHDLQLVYPTVIESYDGETTTRSNRRLTVTLKFNGSEYPFDEWKDVPGEGW